MEIKTEPKKEQKPELNAVTKKILIILGLTFALLIPLAQVENQIYDRKTYEVVAQEEVAKGWGKDVTIGSPSASYFDKTYYPANGNTTISIDSKEKKRGVFHVPVYVATVKTTVTFAKPAPSTIFKSVKDKEKEKTRKLDDWDYITLPVKPTSSIQSVKITAGGKEIKGKLVSGGVRFAIADLPGQDLFAGPIEFEIAARGTGPMVYDSNSDQEKVQMTGNWTKPKFIEQILPTESSLTKKGFSATWNLNALPKLDDSSRETKSIGLTHLWVGTDYTMIERAVKYGILFIALTFLLMIIVEVMSKIKVHPLQYGLIGLSISIFYLLLLAISESTGFDIAYLISSLAVTSLIVFYVRGFLNQKKFVWIILLEQVTLSGFFYVLLSLEEASLLVGSVGLFLALAAFMTITRKFDWYAGAFKNVENHQS